MACGARSAVRAGWAHASLAAGVQPNRVIWGFDHRIRSDRSQILARELVVDRVADARALHRLLHERPELALQLHLGLARPVFRWRWLVGVGWRWLALVGVGWSRLSAVVVFVAGSCCGAAGAVQESSALLAGQKRPGQGEQQRPSASQSANQLSKWRARAPAAERALGVAELVRVHVVRALGRLARLGRLAGREAEEALDAAAAFLRLPFGWRAVRFGSVRFGCFAMPGGGSERCGPCSLWTRGRAAGTVRAGGTPRSLITG